MITENDNEYKKISLKEYNNPDDDNKEFNELISYNDEEREYRDEKIG